MTVLALDPGNTRSALVELTGDRVTGVWQQDNVTLLVETLPMLFRPDGRTLVIEKIESYGMSVGAETFDTAFWSGRFAQAWQGPHGRLGRKAVKLHLCGTARAKDANIRAALMDRFGGSSAKGTKAAPGPLYHVSSHAWAALAVAVTWHDGIRQ